MALISVGYQIIKGTKCEVFYDTDELDNPEYYYYHKAKSLGRNDVAEQILVGELTAKTIEESEEYEWLSD